MDSSLNNQTSGNTSGLNDQYYKDLIQKDIFELMGFTNLGKEKKKELTDKIMSTVQERCLARIFADLTEEEAKQIDKLFEEDKFDEATQTILKNKNIDIPKIFTQELIIYKNEMVQSADLVKKRLADQSDNQEDQSEDNQTREE